MNLKITQKYMETFDGIKEDEWIFTTFTDWKLDVTI
jgi:hypothetical protein